MKPVRSLLSVAVTAALVATPLALTSGAPAQAAASTPASASPHMHINCAYASGLCTEVHNSYGVFGHYVGHDEPSVLFNSNTPGSGNHMRYTLSIAADQPRRPAIRTRPTSHTRSSSAGPNGWAWPCARRSPTPSR